MKNNFQTANMFRLDRKQEQNWAKDKEKIPAQKRSSHAIGCERKTSYSRGNVVSGIKGWWFKKLAKQMFNKANPEHHFKFSNC